VQAISHHLADYAKGMGYRGDVSVVPNAVDTLHFSHVYDRSEIAIKERDLGKNPGDIIMITTSRLVPKNGLIDVIQSLTLLPKNIKFAVLGVGPDEAEMKEAALELGVAERVSWLGFVSHKDIPVYLQASDIFIRPSLSEGLGNSFLEAMASGLPVIATPVGGIIDFLFDPQASPDKPPTGLFCKVKNPQSIAEQVQRLVADQLLRDELIINGQALVREKYDWNIIAGDMRKVFDRLIS
jgi:glycosyltransferase involved in cell wall biosynthesis